jgi:hypothetical protein
LHRRHCAECQRAYVKSHDGVDVPAPPPLEPMGAMPGQVIAGKPGPCAVCEGNVVVASADPHAPGYAVVGGPVAMASNGAPGYAVVGENSSGLDPAPVGVYRAGQAHPGDPRMAAMGHQPGAHDSSVVPASLPPAQVALARPGHDRPHVIAHLFGIPKFGQVRREWADKERQKHASIAYDQPEQAVTSLPASVVYGKNR